LPSKVWTISVSLRGVPTSVISPEPLGAGAEVAVAVVPEAVVAVAVVPEAVVAAGCWACWVAWLGEQAVRIIVMITTSAVTTENKRYFWFIPSSPQTGSIKGVNCKAWIKQYLFILLSPPRSAANFA
jgi:hypothetical protein